MVTLGVGKNPNLSRFRLADEIPETLRRSVIKNIEKGKVPNLPPGVSTSEYLGFPVTEISPEARNAVILRAEPEDPNLKTEEEKTLQRSVDQRLGRVPEEVDKAAAIDNPFRIEHFEHMQANNPFARDPNNPFDIEPQGAGTEADFFQMMATGALKTTGLPLDLMVNLTNMINGTNFAPFTAVAQQDLSKSNITVPYGMERQTFMGRVGRTVGEAVAATAMMGFGAAGVAAKGARLGTLGLGSMGKRLFERMGSEIIQRPGRFVALEIGAGTGAGGGEYFASKLFPDSLAATVVGQLLGGVVTLVPLQISSAAKGAAIRGAVNLTKRTKKRVLMPFTKKGGRILGGQRLAGVSGLPREVAVSRLNEEDVIEGILSPAQRLGERRALALEREVLDSAPELERYGIDQVIDANRLIHEQIVHFAGSKGPLSPEDLVSYLADTRIYLKNLIQMRMAKAAARADVKIGRAGPKLQTAEEASKIVREELDTALLQMRATETELHMAVPKGEVVEATTLINNFNELLANTAMAQHKRIPAEARRLLIRNTNVSTGKTMPAKIGEFTTSNELIGLRTEMLDEARDAAKKGDYTRARFAGQIAGWALDELNASKSVSVPFQKAREFSNLLNDQFTQGPVGKLLGYGRTTTSTGLTLENMINRGGQRAKENFEAVIEAVDVSGPKVREAVTEFLRNAVVDADGVVNVKKVSRILEKQAPLLNRFPRLRNEFREVVKDVLRAENIAKQGQKRIKDLDDKRLSAVGSILGADPGKELNTIMNQRDRVKLMRNLNRRTKGVPNARKGLKLTLVEHLVAQSKSSFKDELGETLLDGAGLNLKINKEIKVLREVLTDNEITRLKKIATTAERLLKAVDVKNLPEVGGISTDIPAKLIDGLIRTAGARIGAWAGAGTTGASLLTAHFGAQRAREMLRTITKTEAEKVIIESIFDGELYKALFMEATEPKAADVAVGIIQKKLKQYFDAPAATVKQTVKGGIEAVGARILPVTAGVPLQTGLREGMARTSENPLP